MKRNLLEKLFNESVSIVTPNMEIKCSLNKLRRKIYVRIARYPLGVKGTKYIADLRFTYYRTSIIFSSDELSDVHPIFNYSDELWESLGGGKEAYRGLIGLENYSKLRDEIDAAVSKVVEALYGTTADAENT